MPFGFRPLSEKKPFACESRSLQPFFSTVLVIKVRVGNVTWRWRWLLDLRIVCPNSFNSFCFKTCFNSTQHWTTCATWAHVLQEFWLTCCTFSSSSVSPKLLKFHDSQCKTKHTGCWSFWNQRQGWGCLLSFDAQIECLEVRSSATHEIEDWHWAQTLQVYWQWLSTVSTASGRSSELWCFKKHHSHLCPSHWKAIIFVPESLRQRQLRHSESRVPQVPWRRGTEKGKRENMPPQSMFLSVCVFVWCLCVVNTAVSLNMKIWERFWLKLTSHHFKWISNCLPLVWMDGGSPTPSGNMIITFIICISL